MRAILIRRLAVRRLARWLGSAFYPALILVALVMAGHRAGLIALAS